MHKTITLDTDRGKEVKLVLHPWKVCHTFTAADGVAGFGVP